MRENKGTQETKPQGYINLHRKIREHWIWEDPVKFQWWLDILMECNYTARKVNIGYNVIECQRGQSINSLLTWAKRWRSNKNSVARFLKMLQKEGMIRIENVKKTTRITVCNYDTYNQSRDETGTKQGQYRDDQGMIKGHDSATNKKDKKDKKRERAPGSSQTYGSSSEQTVGPTLEDVRRVFYQNGGTQEMADAFFGKHSATGWRLNNTPIVNYVSLVPTFIKNYLRVEEKSGGYTSLTPANGKLQPNDYV